MRYYIASLVFLFSLSTFAADTDAGSTSDSKTKSKVVQKVAQQSIKYALKSDKGEKKEASSEDLGQAAPVVNAANSISADASKYTVGTSSISAEAETANTKFAVAKAKLAAMEPHMAFYPASAAAFKILQANVLSYETQKKVCTTAAEAANLFCPEGNSPGAKAAKLVMDVGAPVLAVISSAQKACSSAAKITSAAATALSVAKGLCVSSKATCDLTCSGATAKLKTIQANIEAFKVKFFAEYELSLVPCAALVVPAPYNPVFCEGVMEGYIAGTPLINAVTASVAPENVPATPGTSPFIAAKCTGYSKDLALFAVNLANTLIAKKGASDCEEKLTSSGADPEKITALQYCETPGNANTQFCICKANDKQEGCAGYQTKLTDVPTLTDDEQGTDTKNTGAGNQFAGGFGNQKALGGFKLGSGGGLSPTEGAGYDGGSSADSGAGGLTATGKGPGPSSGDSGSGASGAGSEKDSVGKGIAADDKKKWSFGSFGGGGFGGGSGSGSGNGSRNKLGQREMDAIKRQMASEQLRAEVSEKSGKSNWEKVRAQYTSKTPTFLLGK